MSSKVPTKTGVLLSFIMVMNQILTKYIINVGSMLDLRIAEFFTTSEKKVFKISEIIWRFDRVSPFSTEVMLSLFICKKRRIVS